MYEFDHMLNGRGTHQHILEMIREAEQDTLARDVEAAQAKPHKPVSLLRAVLVTIIHMIWR